MKVFMLDVPFILHTILEELFNLSIEFQFHDDKIVIITIWYTYPLLLFSWSVVSDSLWSHRLQYARLPCPSLSPAVCSNSCLLSHWCYPNIPFSVIPSPPALKPSQHQGLFQWIGSLHQVAKVLELIIIHSSFL